MFHNFTKMKERIINKISSPTDESDNYFRVSGKNISTK